ncbi:MAG: amidohydrolase family protein, partial [Pseudomonadota bacterium]
AVMGHCIHLDAREAAALGASGASIAHCPTSNAFIGSGLCDVRGLAEAGALVGLATDVGGGSSFSMLRTMAAAYEVSQLRGAPLHPAELLWLASEGSARAMGVQGVVGTLAEGAEADLIALDLRASPVLAQRAARAESVWDELFAAMMLGDDRCVSGVWIEGRRVLGG